MGFSLDISNHKKGLNIQQLKDEGLYHLYLKATEGMGYVDPCLEDFYNQAVNAGVPLGYYHFATANPNIEGQAEDFYNAVKGKKADLLYSLDMERDMPTGVSYSDFARRFINKFESLMGKTNICNIYASAYYARDNFDQDIKDRIPLWVAQYGTGAGNYIGTGFKNICGHQYSENESHGGQPCDSNIFYPSIVLGTPTNVTESIKEPVHKQSNGIYNYEQHGNAEVLVSKLNVRTEPSVNAPIVASYTRGQTIYNYDRVFENDGYRWIRYMGGSGNYRYVAVRVLSTNERYANCY